MDGAGVTRFRLHVHRQALHSADPKKWYVHLDAWGPDPQAFVDVFVTVASWTVVALEGGCGCAQAWIEGLVDEDQFDYSADGNELYIGAGARELAQRAKA